MVDPDVSAPQTAPQVGVLLAAQAATLRWGAQLAPTPAARHARETRLLAVRREEAAKALAEGGVVEGRLAETGACPMPLHLRPTHTDGQRGQAGGGREWGAPHAPPPTSHTVTVRGARRGVA